MAMIAAHISGLPWSFTAHRWDIGDRNLLATKVSQASFDRAISLDGFRLLSKQVSESDKIKVCVVHMGVSSQSTFTQRRNSARAEPELARQEHAAFRRGELVFRGWRLTRAAPRQMLGTGTNALTANDVEPNLAQKGVDMRIGLDVAWLSTKRLVERIILCTRDRDIIPAMKFAGREGVQIAVATLGASVNPGLFEHADLIRAYMPAPPAAAPIAAP